MINNETVLDLIKLDLIGKIPTLRNTKTSRNSDMIDQKFAELLSSLGKAILNRGTKTTLDGTNYDTINSGQALVADSIYAFSFILLKADAFNIRTPTTGGCTVNICRVQELPVEYS